MADLALSFDAGANAADLCIANGDLVLDDGLASLVLASLLTDARADPRDVEPGETDLRGWWGDALQDRPWGGLLWLLNRAKATAEVMRLARDYCAAALDWMIEDGIAASIDVTAERIDGVGDGATLALNVQITRPNGERVNLLYDRLWSAAA